MVKITYFSIFFFIFLTSCDYINFSKKNKESLVNERIKEIQVNGLELYPEITPCHNISGKQCFEKQLINELKKTIKKSKIPHGNLTNDTLWLTIEIEKNGMVNLKNISNNTNIIIKKTIETTLKDISPIKPATIRGIEIKSNFKVPLILKIKNS